MIERVRLHVATARFLAARRGDSMWEVASDSAALALGRLASRLKPWELEEWICATTGAGQSGPAVVCSENPLEAKLTREAFAGLGQVARLAAFGGRSARTPAAGRAACGASCGGQQ